MLYSHPTVLVVDDDEDCRVVLTEIIQAQGYAVETACDGRDALQILREVHPCIILLDLMMPDMSGVEFREVQLADERLAGIPVIVHSASHDVGEQAKQLGAVAYAVKPYGMHPLLALIREHCLK